MTDRGAARVRACLRVRHAGHRPVEAQSNSWVSTAEVLVALVLALALPVASSGASSGASWGASSGVASETSPGTRKDARAARGLFVDPFMKAAQAGSAFAAIGSRAQPLWITDYYGSPEGARDAVARFVGRAAEVGKTPLLVVYNIPDRDCGLYSSQDDQITDAYYRSWVKQVAAGIGSSKPIVVLEPDALPFIGDPRCTGRGHRLALLKYATQALTRAGAWVYIDAGHSGWRTPAYMAPLLVKAGVA
ncbi:MAG: glycoside hydrolase family 6 protein, partial [Nocardioides sp.]